MSETFGETLRRWRELRGLSLRELGGRVYLHYTHVQQMEKERRRVSLEQAAAFDRALEAHGELVAVRLETMDRRELLGVAGVLALEGVTDRLNFVRANPRRLDAATLDGLGDVLAALRRTEDRLGGNAVLRPVLGLYDLAFSLAQDSRGPIHAATLRLVSELSQYLGWLHMPPHHVGPTAQQWFLRSIQVGRDAGDQLAVATAMSFAGFQYICMNKNEDGLTFAELAVRDTSVHHSLRTYVTYQIAETKARCGDHAGARDALATADRMVDRMPDDNPESGYWYSPSYLQGNHAFVLMHLGEKVQAQREAEDSLAAMPAEYQGAEWALYRRMLAEDKLTPETHRLVNAE